MGTEKGKVCLCLKWALSKEETCVFLFPPSGRGRAGNRNYILQHAQTRSSCWASTCQSKCTAQGGSSLHQAQEGDKRPSRKVVCAGGSDLCRTNDPGSQVSPGPGCIYTLAALTQGSGYVTGSGRSSSCGYYGLQGHAGCQGEISCGPFLWGYLGCRVCVQ